MAEGGVKDKVNGSTLEACAGDYLIYLRILPGFGSTDPRVFLELEAYYPTEDLGQRTSGAFTCLFLNV